jgi:hypothetical protein
MHNCRRVPIGWGFTDPRHLYVSKAGYAGGNGSAMAPFLTIQAAVDAAQALATPPSDTAPVVIHVGPGTFVEEVVVKKTQINLVGAGEYSTVIQPAAGVALTYTNATLASLALYRAAYNYALLAAEDVPEAGPITNVVRDMKIIGPAGGRGIECLGVKGDNGAGLKTAFLSGFPGLRMDRIRLQTSGTHKLYARNAGAVQFYRCWAPSAGLTECVNVTWPSFFHMDSGVPLSYSYDAADPLGTPSNGNGYFWAYHSAFGIVTLSGAAKASNLLYVRCQGFVLGGTSYVDAIYGGFIDGNVDVNDTARFQAYQTYITGNIDIEATARLHIGDVTVRGTTTLAAGAGLADEADCRFKGLITDAGDRLKHLGGVRCGRTTYAGPGAGDLVIVYADTFPATASVSVTATVEDSGSGAATCIIKAGTNLVTGVTFTLSGPCIVNWRAEKVK